MSGGVDTDAFFWNICYCSDHISGGWERNSFCNYIKNSWAIPNTSLFSFLFWTVLHLCMWSLKIKCNEMEQHRMAHNSSKGHYLLMVGVHCIVIRRVPFWGLFWHWFLEVQSTYMGKLISSFAQLLFQGLWRKATFPESPALQCSQPLQGNGKLLRNPIPSHQNMTNPGFTVWLQPPKQPPPVKIPIQRIWLYEKPFLH